MKSHPYLHQPKKAFWSKSVASNFDPIELIDESARLLRSGDKVVSAGSCFAANLVPYLESAGINYIRTEELPKQILALGENLGYANFSAAYGNIYTARQLRQLYEMSLGLFSPIEEYWHENNLFIDPFRPGLRFPAKTQDEFEFIRKNHLKATKSAFENSDVFVFTLGLTEGWQHKIDHATYPTCPGTIAGTFDYSKHEFINFKVDEIVNDLSWFIETVSNSNPRVNFILTVSPVPLVATASKSHVLNSTIYSKSVLRVAVQELISNLKNVIYFPSYEIITGPQAKNSFFEPDLRNVSKEGIDLVMGTLIKASGLDSNQPLLNKSAKSGGEKISTAAKNISDIECEEVSLDAN